MKPEQIEKQYYLRAALHGLKREARMADAALLFYHCNVPPATAHEYLKVLQGKLK